VPEKSAYRNVALGAYGTNWSRGNIHIAREGKVT